ncbi:MAG TPA: hypothetical protein VMS37_25085 [Verrucomicrobiae bacterium]|nr:hypothetical protein [Verrucomicrobiae bacterium]
MSENVEELIKQHHAFYEVSPYYVVIEQSHGRPSPSTRRILAGFDVDVYGARTNGEPEPSPEYAQAYAALQEVAETTKRQASDSCSVEVIAFPSTVRLDTQNHLQEEAILRIRVSHYRGLDQPAGHAEQRALDEIEKQLQGLGVARR